MSGENRTWIGSDFRRVQLNMTGDKPSLQTRRDPMKKLLVAMTFATVVGSPAFAQSYDPGVGTGNLNARPYRNDRAIQSGTPYDARAQLRQIERAKRMSAPREKR
jgi:hypothetical protein